MSTKPIIIAALLSTVSLAGVARAQTSAEPAAVAQASDAADDGVEEILVTAQKTGSAESLQDVPIAISAIGGAQIEAEGINNITDVGYRFPNVRLETGGNLPGYANYAIRGMGVNGTTASDEPSVITVVDGMVLGNSAGAVLDSFDMEQVEILRGPQGVLFGKNATGGAVSVRTKRPSFDGPGLDARATIGTDDMYALSAAGNAVLSETAALRLSGTYNHEGGHWRNLTLGGREGASETVSIRPSIRLKPTENLEFTLIGDYSKYTGSGSVTGQTTTNTVAFTQYGVTPCIGEGNVCLNDRSRAQWRNWHVIGELNYDVGPGTITSITAYRDYYIHSQKIDVDATPASVFAISPNFDQHQFSEELRYAGSSFDGRLQYVGGVYLFSQKYTTSEIRELGTGRGLPERLVGGKGRLDQSSTAVFGNVRFEVVDTVTLSAGGRYTWEDKNFDITTLGTNVCIPTVASCAYLFSPKFSSNKFSPKVGAEWKPTDDFLAYASFTRGFRAGGYNLRTAAPAVPLPFLDESVDAYEIGQKADLFDRKLRLNTSLFYNKFSDLQRQVIRPGASVGTTTSIFNAADAVIKGAELEVVAVPTSGLRLTGALGYIDASYKSFNGLDLTGDGVADPVIAKELKLERAPKWTYSLAAEYTIDLGNGRDLSIGGDYNYTGSYPSATTNLYFVDPLRIANAHVNLDVNDNVTIAAFVRNLGDIRYAHLVSFSPPTSTTDYLAPPRTFGLSVSLKY